MQQQALRQQAERLIEVEWAPSPSSVFLVAIQVEALDRKGLLSDVTRVLSEQHVNILSATVTTSRDRVAISRFGAVRVTKVRRSGCPSVAFLNSNRS